MGSLCASCGEAKACPLLSPDGTLGSQEENLDEHWGGGPVVP